MKDLFGSAVSDKERLYEWITKRNWCRTSDIIRWGLENFSNRAERNARQLCEDGLIERMSEEEKKHIFGEIKEEVWVKRRQKNGY